MLFLEENYKAQEEGQGNHGLHYWEQKTEGENNRAGWGDKEASETKELSRITRIHRAQWGWGLRRVFYLQSNKAFLSRILKFFNCML